VLVHGDVLMSRRRPLSIAFNHCNVNYVINSFVFCVSYMQSAFAFAVQDVSAFLRKRINWLRKVYKNAWKKSKWNKINTTSIFTVWFSVLRLPCQLCE